MACDTATKSDGHRLTLSRSEHGVLVTLPQRSRKEDLHFVPDTGANGWVLFADERRLPTITPLGTASVHSLSGARSAAGALIEELCVGAIRFRNQRAVIITAIGLVARTAMACFPFISSPESLSIRANTN